VVPDEIWFTGSNATRAPAARASSAVASVELLSQTTTSPASGASAIASRSWTRVAGSSAASL
jgi:hypothetical protein